MFNMFIKILKKEKIHGLFKGALTPILNNFPLNAVLFSEYGRMYNIVKSNYNFENELLNCFLSGCWAGFLSSFLICPSELIKCQAQVEEDRMLKISEILNNIVKNHGFRGIYRGFWATLNRDIIGFGIYFGTYNYFKQKGEDKGYNSFTFFFLIGGISGVISWSTYPFDVVKTRIQSHYIKEKAISQIEAFKYIYQKQGIQGFFKGFMPCCSRAFLTNSIIFSTNEYCHMVLNPLFFENS